MIPQRSARELFEHFVSAAIAAPHPDTPRTATNKALVLRYFEMWNHGDGSLADLLVGAMYLDHTHPEVLGPAALRSLVPRFHATHPSWEHRTTIAAASEDFVAARNCITRMHHGQLVGSEGVVLFRIEGGKLAEQWSWYPPAPDALAYVATRPPIEAWLSFRA